MNGCGGGGPWSSWGIWGGWDSFAGSRRYTGGGTWRIPRSARRAGGRSPSTRRRRCPSTWTVSRAGRPPCASQSSRPPSTSASSPPPLPSPRVGERKKVRGLALSRRDPPVYEQGLPGYVRGGGGEEEAGGRHVGGVALAAHGDLTPEAASQVVRESLRRQHRPRRHAVDLEGGGQGEGQRPGEHEEAALGDAVGDVGGPGPDAADVADVDDPAAAPLHHAAGGLAQEKRPAQVDAEEAVPLGRCRLAERCPEENPRVVDQEVQAAEPADGPGHHAPPARPGA